MKTFEQFLTEAGAGQGRKVRVRDASSPTNIPQGMSARERRKIQQQMASQQRGGTSPDEARRHLQAQLAAQKAATRAQEENKSQLAKASEALAAQKQDPAYKEQQNKLAKARERSARRAAKKANP